ncbi:PucR family transcriptional regulator [Leekyejoonella antrihumi]|uniref:PucR family transcriptional regulator n=1 Tax=Leekyejoonella antrihumi TaxID=1660198 RepID=UPI001647F8CA|nr:helix-turn-helix domain-containing protein [Leekyejoonella antrihumi]
MASDLQRLVDHLGTRLHRSVAIDDPSIRLLAYTSHTGEVDRARTESIMRRRVSTELTSYLGAQSPSHADDLFTVPACPAIGLETDRIGMPILYEDSMLGYLWLIGSDGPVTGQDAESVREASRQAALILHRERLTVEVTRSRERELVRDLVSPDASLRAEAADELIEEDLIVAGQISAIVATADHGPSEPLSEQQRLALHIAVDYGQHQLALKHALALNRPDHSLLLITQDGSQPAKSAALEQLAQKVHQRLTLELRSQPAPSGWVGIAGAHRNLTDAHHAYHEARRAADVARITGALGTVVPYSRLGVYALLAKLPPHELAEGIHPGVRPLLDPDSTHRDLIETVQVYLDNAADAQRTAAELHIHRATLYYRLRRIEDLSGLDLSRGDDRLAIHLSLKLAQLTQLR